MRRSFARTSALVRFVYSRCGASGGRDAAARGAVQVAPGDASALCRAIEANWPAVIPAGSGEGLLASLQSLPKLAELSELCGHRQVTVRLKKARFPVFGAAEGERTFGDVAKRSPYEDVEKVALRDVMAELQSQESPGRYAASVPLERDLPELSALLKPQEEALASSVGFALGPPVPGAPVMYLGAGGQRTPLHCDPTENITVVVQGQKRFRLFGPAAFPFLRPQGGLLPAISCWLSGVVPAVYSPVDAFAEASYWRRTSPRPGCPAPL
ncbi:hypothetical protein AK812_SmicGene19742, partial [Symbiodinium microadriaticum]